MFAIAVEGRGMNFAVSDGRWSSYTYFRLSYFRGRSIAVKLGPQTAVTAISEHF